MKIESSSLTLSSAHAALVRRQPGSGDLKQLDRSRIGAIALDHVATPFSYRNADNQTMDSVAESGMYLTEKGLAGLIQQIDISV